MRKGSPKSLGVPIRWVGGFHVLRVAISAGSPVPAGAFGNMQFTLKYVF